MSIIRSISSALWQAGIDPGHVSGSGLRRGWDYWLPLTVSDGTLTGSAPNVATAKPDTDGNGLARLPHAYLLRGEQLPVGALPVLDLTMSTTELRAGIWRQCLIRPADDSVSEGGNPFLGKRGTELCTSSRHLMALVGHPPRDLALWLDNLRARDPDLFRLVLAKDFRGAYAAHPNIIDEPWPEVVRTLWQKDEGDFLPPFRIAILYAELARLAMNQAGLFALAIEGQVEITTKRLLDRIKTSWVPGTSRAAKSAIANAPYQTLALTPPSSMLDNKDLGAIAAWAYAGASSIALAAGTRGGISIAPQTPTDAASLRDGFAAHPQYQPEPRTKHGFSFQPRRAPSFWGVNWRLNAAVRLLEIAETARTWNRACRPTGPGLPDTTPRKSASPVARAIVAIRFRWAAEHTPASALILLDEMMTRDQKSEEQFNQLAPQNIDPLTVDLCLGDKAGLNLFQQAWEAYHLLPPPGDIGYTARSQAHLWLDTVGDDIKHYRHYQTDALRHYDRARSGDLPLELRDPSRVPPEAVALLGRQQGISLRQGGMGSNPTPSMAMTADPVAAIGAQIQGQMISPWSLDPMHARLKRRKS